VTEQRDKLSLQKELVLAAKAMVSFSCPIFDLATNNCSLGQGDEAKEHNTTLELLAMVAFNLQQVGQQVKNAFGKWQGVTVTSSTRVPGNRIYCNCCPQITITWLYYFKITGTFS
jgi:hypothetical protein